jgi:SH3 domain protein
MSAEIRLPSATKVLAAAALLGLSTGAAVAQETRYITDILQLGIHRAQDTSDAPFDNLVSGTEVTVLERVPNFARVRTPDGEEGWVKSAFLIADKPAQLRVTEAEERSAALQRELAEARAAQDDANAEAGQVVAEAEQTLAAAEAERESLARLRAENAEYESRMELYRGSVPWPWVAGALVVVLGAGFAAGYWWLDASIRRRHGGFRVY